MPFVTKGERVNKTIRVVLIIAGITLLCLAGYAKFFMRPHMASGVRIISLILLANTTFLAAILYKLSEKK